MKWFCEKRKNIGIVLVIIAFICVGIGLFVNGTKDKKPDTVAKTSARAQTEKKDQERISEIGDESKGKSGSEIHNVDDKKNKDNKNIVQSEDNGEVHSDNKKEESKIHSPEIQANAKDQNENSDINVSEGQENKNAVNDLSDSDNENALPSENADSPEEKNKEELHEPKWIVDQAAWTETVSEPAYETRECSICDVCGTDITGYETVHLKEHMLNGENGSWKSGWYYVQVGTNTYEIFHEEEGHWE